MRLAETTHIKRNTRRPTSERQQVTELQRRRILTAAVTAVSEHGVERATIARIVSLAGVSRKTFYTVFEDRDDCLRGAIEQGVAVAGERAARAGARKTEWVEQVRAGLFSLLEFFDERPQLAQLWVGQAATADAATLKFRSELLQQLAGLIEKGCEGARRPPSAHTGEGIAAGTLGVVHARLLQPTPGKLTDLLNQLMSFIVLPYRGPAAARRELERAAPAPTMAARANGKLDPPPRPEMRITYRTIRVLAAVAAQPGLSNTRASEHAGIKDQGQISKLLGRLAHLGLIENRADGRVKGGCNAWHLTPHGQHFAGAMERELLTSSDL
jgi:AcrR family transcriptional regulator